MRRLSSTFGHGSPGAGSCRCAWLPVSVLSSMASWYCALNRRWYPRYCTPSRPVLDFCSSQHIVDADRRSGRGGRRVVVRLLVRTSVALDHDGNPVCRPGTDRTGRLIARCPPFRVGELTRFSAVVPNTGGETAPSYGAPAYGQVRFPIKAIHPLVIDVGKFLPQQIVNASVAKATPGVRHVDDGSVQRRGQFVHNRRIAIAVPA